MESIEVNIGKPRSKIRFWGHAMDFSDLSPVVLKQERPKSFCSCELYPLTSTVLEIKTEKG